MERMVNMEINGVSTETPNSKTTDQLSKYEFITIDPDQLISKASKQTVPNM